MLMDNIVSEDVYELDLWAGNQLLWNSSFKPSRHGEQGGQGLCAHSQLALGWGAGSIQGWGLQAAFCLFPNLMGFLLPSGAQSTCL